MKKRIACFGGNRFMTLVFQNNEFLPTYNYVINKLNINYDVTNYAKPDCDIKTINRLVKLAINSFDFKEVYLSLGEYESTMCPEKTLLTFNEVKTVIEDMFIFLKDNKVNVNIELLNPINKGQELINELILNLSNSYNFKIINKDVAIKMIGNDKYILSSLYI